MRGIQTSITLLLMMELIYKVRVLLPEPEESVLLVEKLAADEAVGVVSSYLQTNEAEEVSLPKKGMMREQLLRWSTSFKPLTIQTQIALTIALIQTTWNRRT